MPAQIIDGKGLATRIRQEIAAETAQLKESTGLVPGLAVLLVGDNPASKIYVRNKEKACETAGIYTEQHTLPAETSEADLLAQIDALNNNPQIHGILIQLHLPASLNEARILQSVDPKKDVDGFHPINQGRLLAGLPAPRPCTPLGLIRILESIDYDLTGKEAIVIGRSQIVGKPAALLLLERHATVTICHSRTQDLPATVRRADVVVAAVGRSEMVRGDWLKPGAVVLDVGINRDEEGKLHGDVAFAEAVEVASYITPVPGGVGPMTIAMLLHNTLKAAKRAGTP